MTRSDIQTAVLATLCRIAPEIDASAVSPDARLREAFDLDSMDFLNFVVGLSQGLGVEVPESDYGKIATLGSCVEYLATRL